MILINLELTVRPDGREGWLREIRRYADAVRAEAGCLFFDCFESVDTANDFVIVEGFASSEAGERHTGTEHFHQFISFMPSVVAAQPKIINVEVPHDEWSTMSEIQIDG